MIDGLCCNFQPCDSADAQEPATQEEEESTHELVDINNGMCYSGQHLFKKMLFRFQNTHMILVYCSNSSGLGVLIEISVDFTAKLMLTCLHIFQKSQ